MTAIGFPLKTIDGMPRPGTATVIGLNTRGLPVEVLIDTEWHDYPVVYHAMPINERRQRELLGG